MLTDDSGFGLGRIDRPTTAAAVVSTIRSAILSGELAPGEYLREATLAARLGVSRAPVREAITRLVDEGYVVKMPYRGTFVARPDGQTIDEIFSLRLRLEPFAMWRARMHDCGAAGDALQSALEAMHTSTADGDLRATTDAHLRFHRTFYHHAKHAVILNLWDSWEGRLRLALARTHGQLGDRWELLNAHAALRDVFLSEVPAEYGRAVQDHIRSGED